MRALRVIPMNESDMATLTSTVAPYATQPLINLKNPRRARVFRFAAAGGNTVKGTRSGQGMPVSGLGLRGFNFEPAATIRFKGYSLSDWTGTTLVDTGVIPAYDALTLGELTWSVSPLGSSVFDGFQGEKQQMYWFTRAQIYSWELILSDTGNSSGYNEISRLWLGDAIELTYNAKMGLRLGWEERTTQEDTDGGSLVSAGRIPRRRLTGDLAYLDATERLDWINFMRYVGMRKEFVITVQAQIGGALERDYTLVGAKFTQIPDLSWEFEAGWSSQFTITES